MFSAFSLPPPSPHLPAGTLHAHLDRPKRAERGDGGGEGGGQALGVAGGGGEVGGAVGGSREGGEGRESREGGKRQRESARAREREREKESEREVGPVEAEHTFGVEHPEAAVLPDGFRCAHAAHQQLVCLQVVYEALSTSVRGRKLLVYEALSYSCMRPEATS